MREAFALYPDESRYTIMGDDEIPRTERWDSELSETAGPVGIAYPADLIWHGKRITQPVVGGDLLRAIGWWTLPGLTHLYVDTVFEHLGRALGCARYRPDIIVEHLHFSVGKSPYDETYRRVDSGKDRECFETWKAAPETQQLIERLRSIAR